MAIPFTQYLMPDGRTRPIEIDLDTTTEETAHHLIAEGCRFEVEMLTTGEISMTCERDANGDVEILAHEIVTNGPEVPKAVNRLIHKAAKTGESMTDDKRQRSEQRIYCRFCGARLKKDYIGWKCPTRNCQWEHGVSDEELLR